MRSRMGRRIASQCVHRLGKGAMDACKNVQEKFGLSAMRSSCGLMMHLRDFRLVGCNCRVEKHGIGWELWLIRDAARVI